MKKTIRHHRNRCPAYLCWSEWKSGRKIEKDIGLWRRREKMEKPYFLVFFRPYLTIVNSRLYDFLFLGLSKRKKRFIHQQELGD
jgi:hypothetical protein